MPATTHFITAPTFHRKRVFHNELFGEMLMDALMRWRHSANVSLHDYVIMPDHIHLLVTTRTDVVAAVESLQRLFAEDVARQYGYAGELWEPAFQDREVHNLEECSECTRMIHSNPVRVGFCDNPREYRMSSKSSRWVLDSLPEHLRPLELQAV